MIVNCYGCGRDVNVDEKSYAKSPDMARYCWRCGTGAGVAGIEALRSKGGRDPRDPDGTLRILFPNREEGDE